jgi:pSer/pThr/pTyr-binding forkhead associated (FHA) protein
MRPGEPGATAYPLTRRHLVIGRSDDCDVRLPDPGASRRHAEVRCVDDEVTIVDLGSTNGTLVNGVRVQQADLADGDEIVIGETPFAFRAAGSDQD